MTPKERRLEEEQIMKDFNDLQEKLAALKAEVQSESDTNKQQEKEQTIQQMERDLSDMQELINTLSRLGEADLQSLKERLEQTKQLYNETRGETVDLLNERATTPTTYELLKDSETYNRLITIISSNPKEFKKLPGDSAEKKLEYIFTKIRNSIVLFLKNKLGNSDNCVQVINNTIAPALERSLLEMLRDQGNDTNVSMLNGMDKISWENFQNLVSGVSKFAGKAAGSYNKFNQWMNAIDYLSVHNGVLNNPEKSGVLTNPLKFQSYINNQKFMESNFSPYTLIEGNIFEISDEENFEFGMSLQEKQAVLTEIGNIQVVNNPKTTALIVKMIDKPEQFLQKTENLQKTANGLLEGVNSLNSVTKIFGLDVLGEITKAPEERSFLYKILDFVCKLIGVTGGLEGIVKRWRSDRMGLTYKENDDISKIFNQYKELAGENAPLNIVDEASCKTALVDFAVTDPKNDSTTKGDFLRDSIADNMDISLISPAIVQQVLGNSYLKKEIITDKGETKERFVIDESKITESDKLKLAHNHLINMKTHLEKYNDNDLSEFYANIHSSEDIVLCITASLYADMNDVIEGVKAKVFLPENYGSVRSDGTVDNGIIDNGVGNQDTTLSELTSQENTEMQNLVEQSKISNSLNYLENPTYKKYLNVIERDLHLPKYSLECVCSQESKGKLYSGNKILESSAGAKGLFQFMPDTANSYMRHSKLEEKYGKTFNSEDEFFKDPLASAWAAGIMYSELMSKYGYNFQSALACYNCGITEYQRKIGKRNLTNDNFHNLPKETTIYVNNVAKNVLQRNSVERDDVLSVNFGQYLWNRDENEGKSVA